MAYLNIICVESIDSAPEPPGDTMFRWTAHHVKEILLHFLPKRFELDGCTKFTLFCGHRPCDEPVYSNVLGASWSYAEDFDYATYYTRDARQREEAVLAALVGVLTRVAVQHGNPTDPVREAAQEVRRCGFFLELSVARLSRTSPDRSHKLTVFRRLSHEDGEAWGIHVFGQDGAHLGTEWITDRPHYLDMTTHFSLSRWDGDVFEIVKRTPQRIWYRLDLGKYRSG
jgi:hypothetical protein